jgi:hypothetical protein
MSSIFYSYTNDPIEITSGSQLYKVPKGKESTVVISTVNTDSLNNDTIRIAIKDYDQTVKLSDNSTVDLEFTDNGNIFSNYTITTSSGNLSNIPPGTIITFADGTTAKVANVYEDYSVETRTVTSQKFDRIYVDSISNFTIGDILTQDLVVATIIYIKPTTNEVYVQYTQGGPFVLDDVTSNNSGSATITDVNQNLDGLFFGSDFAEGFVIDVGKIYKFLLEDTGISDFNIYTNSSYSVPYTYGVSTYKTPGTTDSYLILQVTPETPETLNFGSASYPFNITTLIKGSNLLSGNKRTLILYDVSDIISPTQVFTYNNVQYTVSSVNIGSYGRINRYVNNLNEVKVFVDYGTFDEGSLLVSSNNLYYIINDVYNLKLEDHIEFDRSLESNKSFQRSGIVLQSESSIIVYSENQTSVFNVYGFEE